MGLAKRNGNSLIEYGLIGAVVTVAGIATLLVAGADLTGWLEALRDDMRQQAASTAPALGANGNGLPNGPGSAGNNANAPDNASNGPLTLSINGQRIQVPQAPVVPPITSGGNGSEFTLAFTGSLEQLAERIRQTDPNSPLVGLISDLANAGHRLADSQKVIEGTCQPGGACTTASVGNANIGQVAGFQEYEMVQDLFSQASGNRMTLTQKWQALQAYLKDNPNPALENYIGQQVKDIDAIADDYLASDSQGEQSGIQTYSLAWEGVNTPGSVQTRQGSNNVCQSGGENCTRPVEGQSP